MRVNTNKNHLNNIQGPLKALIYTRISTADQSSYSLDTQKDACKKIVELNDFELVDIIEDDGYSGDNLNRPGIQKVLSMARRKEFNRFVVWKLDRLSRRVKDVLTILEDEFEPRGIKFIIKEESFANTDTPFGTAVISIISTIAQLERANTLERTRIGQLKHLELKRYLGQAAYGYEFNDDSDLVIVDKEAEVVRKIFRLYTTDDLTMAKVAQKLNEEFIRAPRKETWDKASIRNTLSKEIYTGRLVIGRGKIDSPQEYICEPIITPGIFELAQKKTLERSRLAKRNTKRDYIFSGIIFCGKCNMVLSPKVSGNESHSYGYKIKGNERKDSGRCPIKCGTVSESKVADALVRFFISLIWAKTEKELEAELAKHEPDAMKEGEVRADIERLKQEKNKLHDKWDYWMEACAEGNSTKQKRDMELERIRKRDSGIDDKVLILQQSLLTDKEREYQLKRRKVLVARLKASYNNGIFRAVAVHKARDESVRGVGLILHAAKHLVSEMKIEAINVNWDKNSIDIIRARFGDKDKMTDSFEMTTP